VHVLAIAGYAASGAAMLARQLGYLVTGSDEHAYPPVSDMLTAAGIPWANNYDPANLDRFGTPDLVVVSNTARPHNVELAAARERGLPITSEAEFFVDLTGDRVRVAVCGTHGKSTTAALLAHMLERCGMDPGLRLGAVSLDFDASARLGTGPFVFEGDEYATAAKRAFTERWIDLFPAPGKKSGAYSNGGAYDVHPYMLLNYNDTLDDVFTERILTPLGMADTTWWVDEDNAGRLAALYAAVPASPQAFRYDEIGRGARVTLEVRMSNDPAQGLYRKFGFAPAGVRKNYYAETNEDALVMWANDVDTPDYRQRLTRIEAVLPGVETPSSPLPPEGDHG